MSNVQFIERDGKPEFAVVPIELWKRVAALIEDLEDKALFDLAKEQDDGSRIPVAGMKAQIQGTHPIRAWREYRGLTQDALSESCDISKPYLSQIENGKRAGTTRILASLAKALNVQVDLLLD